MREKKSGRVLKERRREGEKKEGVREEEIKTQQEKEMKNSIIFVISLKLTIFL